MDEIKNFITLTDKIGTAGQPRKDQFDLVASAGYQHVINLATPDNDASIDNEAQLVTSLGLNYFHIPVPYDRPKPKHVRQFCLLMKVLDQDKVFVHCIMNYRVSAFLFHYFTKILDMSDHESKSPIFGHWQPEPVWVEMLEWSAKEIGLTSSKL